MGRRVSHLCHVSSTRMQTLGASELGHYLLPAKLLRRELPRHGESAAEQDVEREKPAGLEFLTVLRLCSFRGVGWEARAPNWRLFSRVHG